MTGLRRLGRWAPRSLAVLIVLWLAGFAWFVIDIPDQHTEVLAEGVEGVVVFTGSPGRVESGIAALQAGLADRLLISGVDPELAPEVLRSAITRDDTLFECCIDLGRAALDTEGNAQELIAWANRHSLRRIGLVTADWHMRRSLVELSRYPHDLEIVAMPVATNAGLSRLIVAYSKYLAAVVRAAITAHAAVRET